jgi:hypothetical protein
MYTDKVIVFRKNFNCCLLIGASILRSSHLIWLTETTMNPSQFDRFDNANDAEVRAQLCAYNAAFDELGLRFRWDAHTLASLAMIDGEQAQITAYIQTHHAHLLKAYSPVFLSQAILEKKNARYPVPLSRRVESASHPGSETRQPQLSSRRERVSYDVELPALAGV